MSALMPLTDAAVLLDREAIDAPHDFIARLRSRGPVARVGETGVHAVLTWALIDEALHREDDFSANLTGALIRGADGSPSIFEFPRTAGTANDVIATADEPAHTVHRELIQPRLAAKQITALEPVLRGWTRSALEPWLDAGGGDFAPIAERVPALAVAHLLGLPESDVDDFRDWAMMGGDILAGDLGESNLIALATETGRMAAYLNRHIRGAGDGGEPDPGAPLLAALARGVHSGAIEEIEATGIAIVLFGAAGESTAALIGSVMHVLATRPDLADALRADASMIGRFVEEVVRLEPPFKFHYRLVKRACSLGDTRLEAGDRLMLMWAAANRDPAEFEDADTLKLDRRHPKAHMAFGRGPHFCIGAPLARLEARVIVEEVLAAGRSLELDPTDPPSYTRSIFVRRLERLPIRLGQSSSRDASS